MRFTWSRRRYPSWRLSLKIVKRIKTPLDLLSVRRFVEFTCVTDDTTSTALFSLSAQKKNASTPLSSWSQQKKLCRDVHIFLFYVALTPKRWSAASDFAASMVQRYRVIMMMIIITIMIIICCVIREVRHVARAAPECAGGDTEQTRQKRRALSRWRSCASQSFAGRRTEANVNIVCQRTRRYPLNTKSELATSTIIIVTFNNIHNNG